MKNVNLIFVISVLLITLVQSYACIPPAITAIFKSDDKPPQISNVTISVIDERSAIVNWVTDEMATGRIGVSDEYLSQMPYVDETLSTIHKAKIDLSDFKCNENYEIVILSRDANENESHYEFSKTLIICTFAPDFTLITLNGQTMSLSDFKGKNVLLHFWSYWCHPCTEELPLLQSFYSVFPKDKLELITISVDGDITDVKNLYNRQGYKFPVLLDSDGTVDKKYSNRYVPISYLISGDGYIIDKHGGPFANLNGIRAFTRTQN